MATDVKNDASLSTGLVSYWELEEASGTRVDSHGVNDLTAVGSPSNVSAVQGNGIDLVAASTQYLKITDAAQVGLGGTGSFSIAGWCYPDDLAANIFMCQYGASPQYSFIIQFLNAGTGHLAVYHSANGTSFTIKAVNFGSPMTTGSWQHFAVVYDASAGTYKAYRNASAGATVTSYPTSRYNSNADFEIGWRSLGAAGEKFDGGLDEFGFWDKALTSTEVTDLYNSGTGIPYDAGGTFTKPNFKGFSRL